jgi:hypothetical protein
VNILYYNHIIPPYSFLYALLPTPITQQISVCFVILSSYIDALYVNIFHPLSFSFPLPPLPKLLKQSYYGKHILYTYIWSSLYLYMFIFWIYLPHMWEEHATFLFLNLFCLT